MTRVPLGAVVAVCALLAGAVVFVETNGVVETITAAAIVIAVGSVVTRLVKSVA